MIKNVIFDVGRVLLRYSPKKYLVDLGYNGKEVHDIMELIFQSEIWLELDRGSLNRDEAIDILINKKPELKDKIDHVMKNWQDHLNSIKENTSILKDIKKKGKKLYIISNFGSDAFNIVRGKFNYFELFDDIIISADVKMLKPDEEIYLHLLNKHELIPKECVFIDDMEKNIITAQKLGINTIWFKENVIVKEELEKIGVL